MIHEKSADTSILESVLREAEVGQMVTYDQMSKAIGRDVREHARSALATARKTLLKEGLVFGVEAKTGLIRLNDAGILQSTESDRRRVMRATKRSLHKLALVDFEKLDAEDKKKHITMSAQMGTLGMFASSSAQKKIASKVNGKALPIGETLKLFGG